MNNPAIDPNYKIQVLQEEIEQLQKRFINARAEALAIKATIDEAGLGVLPAPTVGHQILPDGTKEEIIVDPRSMQPLWNALRAKARTLVPWAQRVLHQREQLQHRAEAAEAWCYQLHHGLQVVHHHVTTPLPTDNQESLVQHVEALLAIADLTRKSDTATTPQEGQERKPTKPPTPLTYLNLGERTDP